MHFQSFHQSIQQALELYSSPLLNKTRILARLTEIQAIHSEIVAQNKIEKFCLDFFSVLEILLKLDPEQNAKKIKLTLNSLKTVLGSSTTNVIIADFLNISQIKNDFHQTYIANTANRTILDNLKKSLSTCLEILDTSRPQFELENLQNENKNITTTFDEMRKIIRQFEVSIQALYGYSEFQLTAHKPALMLSINSNVGNAPSILKKSYEKLIKILKYSNAAFSVNPKIINEENLRVEIVISSIYSLRATRKFVLTQSPSEPILLPAIAEKRQTILQEFNNNFKAQIRKLAWLKNEIRLGDKLTQGLTQINLSSKSNEGVTQNNSPTVATSSTAATSVRIAIISKQITMKMLPKLEGVTYVIVNQYPVLLEEAAISDQVTTMEWLLKQVQYLYNDTPLHLHLYPTISNSQELQSRLDSIQQQLLTFTSKHDEFIKSLAGNTFSLESNRNLIHISAYMASDIVEPLNKIQQDVQKPQQTLTNYAPIQNELTNISKSINNAGKMLSACIIRFDSFDHLVNSLMIDHQIAIAKFGISKALQEKIIQDCERLAKSDLLVQYQKPVAELIDSYTQIKIIFTQISTLLETITKALEQLDSNDFDTIAHKLKTIFGKIDAYSMDVKSIKKQINDVELLLNRVDLNKQAKYGANIHQFQFTSSSSVLDENKVEIKTTTPRL